MLQKSEWTHMNSFYNYPISIVEDIIVLCYDPLANDLEDIIHAVTRLGVDEGEIGYVRKSYYLHRVRLCKFSCLRSSSDFLLPCLKIWILQFMDHTFSCRNDKRKNSIGCISKELFFVVLTVIGRKWKKKNLSYFANKSSVVFCSTDQQNNSKITIIVS